ncbi:hypothetical protein AXE80_10320 [Wenyingzhuangia fucanilytica]|uniref:GH10 domain-containing protein n=1 Tax=Wenyingzhuangia fucanilytica TaxID=1790137 RepID=A0A1B1Y7A2_9FLAO|nr:endo-1,4-beta-xylanase [Wenyingzhuangia fucanilytica]ANW96645.1 hypothetical protein AXE80_10320 [Wenyingzhuangia fucanilytica]
MMHFKSLLLLLSLGVSSVFSQGPIPTNGESLLEYKKLQHLNIKKQFGGISVVDKDSLILKFDTKEQPKFIYELSAMFPTKSFQPKEKQVYLLAFDAITTKSSLETGEAKLSCILKQSNSYKDNMIQTISIASKWQTYYVPYKTTIVPNPNEFSMVFQFGYRPQTLLMKNIKFIKFPENIKISDLPKTQIKYAGMKKNAAWRNEANDRIKKIRKGTVELVFTDEDDKPLKDTQINVVLSKHSFPFGAAINADEVLNNPAQYSFFKKTFNTAVFENDTKIKSWHRIKNRERVLNAIEVLRQDGIRLKGHVLVWPGFSYLPKEVEKNKDHPKKVISLIENHVTDIVSKTKGKFSSWDVVNEAYTNKDLQEITGSEQIIYNAFKEVKKLDSSIARFTNEYGIISKGGIDTQKQKWYYDFVKRIDEHTNGLVDGVGIQCHMGTDLTPPTKVLSIIDYYSQLKKDISISEFTMEIDDEEIRYQYTRDFMIAAFSKPNVSEFLFWGYHQDKNNKAAFYNKQGRMTAMGAAFYSLVHKEWKTVENFKTNEKGSYELKGFYGTYEYKLLVNDKIHTGTFNLEEGCDKKIKIKL